MTFDPRDMNEKPKRKSIAYRSVRALIAVALGYLVLVLIFMLPLKPSTNPRRYLPILQKYFGVQPEYARHLPAEPPGDVVSFYFHPKFLQGGMSLRLLCEVSSGEMDQLVNSLHSQTNAVVLPDEQRDRLRIPGKRNWMNSNPIVWLVRRQYMLNFQDIPRDFTSFVLGDKMANHGHFYGISVNTNQHQVLYWTDKW